jgi:hypothetical protein
MSFFLLISLALSPVAQDRAVPYTAEVYAPPPVRPFEPPSSFGRVTAEGDGSADPRRRPIVAPVVVEAYSRSYEHAPSTADNAYDRGVDNAEAAMDARMGPLDGLWKLRDADGRLVMQLALMDRGPDRPLEGAFRKVDATAGLGPIDTATYEAGRLSLTLSGARLDLAQTANGWVGTLLEEGQSRTVALAR